MTPARDTQIRRSAKAVQRQLWHNRAKIWNAPRSIDDLIPMPTDVIVESLLRVRLEQPEDIPQERDGFQTAGFLDRATGRIVVAQKYRVEYRRFTMAHEIGHWILHPGLSLHRDRPMTGAERGSTTRPVQEQEADLFASELLMPGTILTKYFRDTFGEAIDHSELSTDAACWLSNPRRNVTFSDLRGNRRRLSMVIAEAPSFGPTNSFIPLAVRFGVSITAMAIQLEDLGLVV